MDRPARHRTRQQDAGDAAEALVAARLTALGWSVLARNLRVGRGELDVVAVDPGPPAALVIVEVRWRHDRGFGLPEESVDWRKRRHLRRAGMTLVDRGLPDGTVLPALPLRFDLVVVEPRGVRHHRHVVEGG
jgi:Holliday junction resolvase-like predicted endonuclease